MALHLGLTGGIGSGKSTVLQMLVTHGAVGIDADAISRQTTAPGGAAIEAIAQAFGPDFITSDGALDRERMRTHVFAHPEARQRLEAIIHPLVGAEIQRQAQAAEQAGARCVVFDVPLLAEGGDRWRGRLDRVLVVDCSPETQVQRVVARNGLAPEAVRAIIAAQASRAQRLATADAVICNDGLSLNQLAKEVAQLAPGFGL